MKPKDDGRLAFPRVIDNPNCWGSDPGMTLRQWLAGQALMGAMASEWGTNHAGCRYRGDMRLPCRRGDRRTGYGKQRIAG